MKKLMQDWRVWALLVIIVAAIFVRTYHFQDWLYFKMDQSRDALLIGNAIDNGPQYLPLLGPRAGATKLKHGYLRLGPAYYYFQYLAGILAGSTKAYVFAYPDLFFSILVLPLLFFFLKIYFSDRHALLITTMYAFSFLIIQYSRFAWNPNSLQFFLVLSFFGLLKFMNEQSEKRRLAWLAVWALGITIGSQLHFFGLFSMLGISGLMFAFHLQIWQKEKIRIYFQKQMLRQFTKYTAVALVVFTFFYTPVIISDIRKHGQNTHNFFEAMGSKAEKKPLTEKVVKDVKENLKYYCLVTTSECYEGGTTKNVLPIAFTALILLAGFALALRQLRKEQNADRRNFLVLLLLWSVVFLILTIPVSFQLRPRFYIVVFATPFIFLGLIFEYLQERLDKKAFWPVILLTALILGLNARGTYAWFKEQAKSQKSAFTVKRTLILKVKDGVTLGQLSGVADWMYAQHEKDKNLYFYVKPEHVRPLEFLLYNKKDNALNFATLDLKGDANAEYFAVTPAKAGLQPVQEKYGKDMIVLAQKQFGQLTVYKFKFTQLPVVENFRFNKKGKKSDRVFWKDVFGIKNKGKKTLQIDGAE